MKYYILPLIKKQSTDYICLKKDEKVWCLIGGIENRDDLILEFYLQTYGVFGKPSYLEKIINSHMTKMVNYKDYICYVIEFPYYEGFLTQTKLLFDKRSKIKNEKKEIHWFVLHSYYMNITNLTAKIIQKIL